MIRPGSRAPRPRESLAADGGVAEGGGVAGGVPAQPAVEVDAAVVVDAAVAVDAVVSARGVRANLRVDGGRVLALVGPNGAGKSTVLGLLAGTVRPDDGEVRIAGSVVAGPRTFVPAHLRRATLLAQDAALFPHLDVLENVSFGPRARRVPRAVARTRAREVLELVGAGDLAGRMPHQLSGGQAQRVALARALATDPHVLLLDEPTSALDVASAAEIRHLLRSVLHDARRTAVVVTHDLLDVLAVATDVAVLANGRVVEAGPTAEVMARPRSAFAAALVGTNLVLGTAEDRTGEIAVVAAATTGSAPPLVLHGLADPACRPGAGAAATFSPRAVSVHVAAPGGSPRNVLEVDVIALERQGELVRVRGAAGGHVLAADITPASVTGLDLAPGARAFFVVKAAEVAIFPA